jgi:hypothetical protein
VTGNDAVPSANLVLFDPPTKESFSFAEQIRNVLEQAHWNVYRAHHGKFPQKFDTYSYSGSDGTTYTNDPAGLHCVAGHNPDRIDLYKKVMQVLSNLGVTCEPSSSFLYPVRNDDPAVITIFVGKDDQQ